MTTLELAILRRSDLTLAHRAVLLWLAHRFGYEPGALSMVELVANVRLPDRTTRRTLHELIDAGLVHKKGHLVEKQRRIVVQLAQDLHDVQFGRPASFVPSEQKQHVSPGTVLAPTTSLSKSNNLLLHTLVVGKESPERKPRRGQIMRVPCPVNFEPAPATRVALAKLCPGVNLDRELIRFIHYWTIGSGAGEQRPGWDQSFLRWCERETGRAGATAPGAAANPFGAAASARSSPARESASDYLRRMVDQTGGGQIIINHEEDHDP